jgi:hypothetical protein
MRAAELDQGAEAAGVQSAGDRTLQAECGEVLGRPGFERGEEHSRNRVALAEFILGTGLGRSKEACQNGKRQ